MEITRTPGEGRIRLDLVGRLDATWSQHVEQTLGECVRAGQHEIALDLARVAFLSSAGIRVLLVKHRELVAIGGRLTIVAASEEVRHVLELTGLRALLDAPGPVATADAAPPAATRLERAGTRYDVRAVAPGAQVRLRPMGDPEALLCHGVLGAELVRESFPPGRIAVGVGAFGDDPLDCRGRLGELLAVGGAAVSLPSSGEGQPDWLVRESRLVPEAYLAYGLVGDGELAYEVRFEPAAEAGPCGIDALVETALEVAGGESAAIAIVAETAQVVGAALRRSPAGQGGGIFGFPRIRDELDFTAEPAHAGSVTVVAGFASRVHVPGLAAHLRPLDRESRVTGHLHAAVFPYRPLPRGRIALEGAVSSLFETQTVAALLHLVHDWRPGVGAGQTRFHRGAMWCGPFAASGTEATRP